MEGRLLTTEHREAAEVVNALADAYVEEVRAATAAAHERLRMGVLRLRPDEPPAAYEVETHDAFPPELDPIFATREFDVPPQAVGGLVSFDLETDADGNPVWKD